MTKRMPRKSKPPQYYRARFLSCGSCSDGWLMNAAGEAYRCWCFLQYLERCQAEKSTT